MPGSIGDLFGNIQAKLKDLGDIESTLDGNGFEKDLSLDTGDKKVTIFDVPVTIDATLSAKAGVLPTGALPEAPAGFNLVKLSDTKQYTTLTVEGQITASGKVDTKVNVLAVSASGSARADFAYKHYVPAEKTAKRLDAFVALGRSSTLPQAADVQKLQPGEVIDFAAHLNVDFGVKASFGAEGDVNEIITQVELAGGALPIPLKAHVGFAASAALGLSLYDSTQVTVARTSTFNDGWVRIRLERIHRNRLAFGTTIDLSIEYDLTAGPLALLDKAFALIPRPQVVQTIKTIADETADITTPAGWEAFKKRITGDAVKAVGRLLDDTKWKEKLAASPEVQQLLATAKRIVAAYDGLDAKVQSIVEDVLARFTPEGLATVKPIIQQIAAIDPTTFKITDVLDLEQRLSENGKLVIHWIEVLTGKDIEELLVSGTLSDALARAKKAAESILKFLDGGASKSVLDELHKLLDQTGVKGIVEWLRANATDLATLQQRADKVISDFIGRLVGKELNALTPADLARIQHFAVGIGNLLAAPDQLKERLKNAANRLKGTLGFNVATEVSRASEFSAIVDVEIDPTNNKAAQATPPLLTGHVGDFLAKLSTLNDHPFLLREVLLTSRHIRTSAASLSVPFFHFGEDEQERTIDEQTIAISPTDERVAHYFGGTLAHRKVTAGSARMEEGTAFISIAAQGPGLDPQAPYSAVVPSLRLTFLREDTKTEATGLTSLRELLNDLSFDAARDAIVAALDGKQTRFTLEVDLATDAVDALKIDGTEAAWNADLLNAAHRWYLDADRTTPDEATAGQRMAQLVRNPRFAAVWTDFPGMPGNNFVAAEQNGEFGMEVLKRPLSPAKNFRPEFRPLQSLMALRSPTFGAFGHFDPASAKSHDPEMLTASSQQAALLFRTGKTDWLPPLLNFWFVMSRLKRFASGTLANTHLVATIRSRAKDTDDWSAPQIFAMEGIPTNRLRV